MHAVLNEDEVTMMDGYPDTDSARSVSWRTGQKAPPGPFLQSSTSADIRARL